MKCSTDSKGCRRVDVLDERGGRGGSTEASRHERGERRDGPKASIVTPWLSLRTRPVTRGLLGEPVDPRAEPDALDGAVNADAAAFGRWNVHAV